MKKTLLIAAMALISVCGFAQKFAHINTQELVQLCPEADAARSTMTAASQEAQETYQAMVDEFNTKYQTYQQKSSTWTQTIKESKEKELTEIQQRIQEFSQNVQMELQQREQELYAPIYEKVNNTIKDLAKKGNYIYVFDATSILYIDSAQSTDLTPEARKVLNIPADRTLESLQAELQAAAQAAQNAQQQ